ncbi:MAG: formate dehydrogenase accessory sulfurtransferase FdhD, partial [Planctomycetota bacterium]|nr:formate dehydrogenase accessory sulfurtransferase FdhD [Planctomycetota bacterium]
STLFEAMKVMRNKQELFEQTAATHAVSLLDLETSTTIDIAEDVGRHNAADKVIGKQLLNDNYPFERATAMLVSGRVSFDLVQKAVRANISVVCAVGMPTSLAIESAQAVGIKLFAWAREDRVSLY